MCLCVCDRIRTYLYNSKIETIFQVFCLVSKSLCPTGERFFFCESKRVVFTEIGKIYLPFNAFECANVEYWDANKRNFTGKKVFFIQYLIYVFSLGFAIESHLTQLQINENPRQCCEYK